VLTLYRTSDGVTLRRAMFPSIRAILVMAAFGIVSIGGSSAFMVLLGNDPTVAPGAKTVIWTLLVGSVCVSVGIMAALFGGSYLSSKRPLFKIVGKDVVENADGGELGHIADVELLLVKTLQGTAGHMIIGHSLRVGHIACESFGDEVILIKNVQIYDVVPMWRSVERVSGELGMLCRRVTVDMRDEEHR
jgi:sporulation protein YlmC with PRC-barrel domain